MTTRSAARVIGSTPYAWPFDGCWPGPRTALLVVASPGAPTPSPAVPLLAERVLEVGGAVLSVRTAPPPARARTTGPAGPAGSSGSAGGGEGHVTTYVVGSAGVDGFYGSQLDHLLRHHGLDRLLLCGGWLETGVHSTMRSANDRGYECLLVLDACSAHDESLRAASRSQIEMSGGIFGCVGATDAVLDALGAIPTPHA